MQDSKQIFELLNDMEFDIENYEKKELSPREKKHLKNSFKTNSKRKFSLRKVGSVAAALLITLGILSQTSLGGVAYAMAQSKLAEMSYSIGQSLGIERDIEPYSNVINQIVENNGVEIKLTDVIIDKDELMFSTIVTTPSPADRVDFDYDIFINGKRLKLTGATGGSVNIDGSKDMFAVNYEVDVKDIEIKENLDMKIILKNFNYGVYGDSMKLESEKDVGGKWKFEFNAKGSELAAQTYSLPLDYSFTIEGQEYKLQEFRHNPVNQKIYGVIENEGKKSYQIELRGYDDLGNEVEFYLSRKDYEHLVFRYSNLHKDMSDQATTITLVPYAAQNPEKSGPMNKDLKQVGREFEIPLK